MYFPRFCKKIRLKWSKPEASRLPMYQFQSSKGALVFCSNVNSEQYALVTCSKTVQNSIFYFNVKTRVSQIPGFKDKRGCCCTFRILYKNPKIIDICTRSDLHLPLESTQILIFWSSCIQFCSWNFCNFTERSWDNSNWDCQTIVEFQHALRMDRERWLVYINE